MWLRDELMDDWFRCAKWFRIRDIRNTKYYCRISLFIRVDSNLFLIANGAWLPTVANEELLLLSAAPTNMPMHEGFTFKMYNEKREYNCNGKYEASITIIIIYELYTQIPIFHPQLKNVHKNLNNNSNRASNRDWWVPAAAKGNHFVWYVYKSSTMMIIFFSCMSLLLQKKNIHVLLGHLFLRWAFCNIGTVFIVFVWLFRWIAQCVWVYDRVCMEYGMDYMFMLYVRVRRMTKRVALFMIFIIDNKQFYCCTDGAYLKYSFI